MAGSEAPDIDVNRSIWLEGSPEGPTVPALAQDTVADVAIIGGGFTGISTAWHLSERFPDRRIVVLEARTLANGASGRNGGMMLNWINGVDMQDPGGTARVFAATRGGIDGIEAIIRDNKLPVRYRRDGCLEIFTDKQRAEAAHARAEQLAAWGIPVRYLDGASLDEAARLRGAVGAVLDPTAGQVNGVDLVRTMANVLVRRGVAIHEGTTVRRVTEGSTIRLETSGGSVDAKAIVLATSAYTPHLGYFRSSIFPLHSHVIATEPAAPGWGAASGFSDDLDRIAYASRTTEGSVVFGGGSNAAYGYQYGNRSSWVGNSEPGFAAVQSRMLAYLPELAAAKITHRWTGTLGVTLSRVCTMGVRGQHKNVYYALGYSGHGITLANLAGRVICDLYSDHHDPWRAMPFYQRRMGCIPPEPFRWVGYHAYTGLTGRSPRRVD